MKIIMTYAHLKACIFRIEKIFLSQKIFDYMEKLLSLFIKKYSSKIVLYFIFYLSLY